MDENLNVVNDTQAQSVDVQTTDDSLQGGSDTENQQANVEPSGQSKDENAVWKQMRLEKEQAEARAAKLERDNTIAQKYGKEYGVYSESDIAEQYGNQGITTLEELENAIEAQDKGIDPELYNRLINLEKEVNEGKALKKQIEQKEKLSKDTDYGKFFNEHEAEITKLANSFSGNLQGDLDVAMTMLIKQKLPELLNQIEAQKTNQQNAESSTGSITGNGSTKETTITEESLEHMSVKDIMANWKAVKKATNMK